MEIYTKICGNFEFKMLESQQTEEIDMYIVFLLNCDKF